MMNGVKEEGSWLDASRATHPAASATPATTTVGKIHQALDLNAWTLWVTIYKLVNER